MDKLILVSCILFVIADIFAIISLALPDWVVTDVGGDQRFGLTSTCLKLPDRERICYKPDLQPEWFISLVCIFTGCVCITMTLILLVISHWDINVAPFAKWVGFIAMVLFCLAAVIFPLGFDMDVIGGQFYELPNSHQVGTSFVLFIIALWLTIISELFAGQICSPHII